jgi:hypothetical protein
MIHRAPRDAPSCELYRNAASGQTQVGAIIMNADSVEISITQRLARAKAEDFNYAQAEAFADRMMARIDPATSEQIARVVLGIEEVICTPGDCGLKAGLQTVTQHQFSKGINRRRK